MPSTTQTHHLRPYIATSPANASSPPTAAQPPPASAPNSATPATHSATATPPNPNSNSQPAITPFSPGKPLDTIIARVFSDVDDNNSNKIHPNACFATYLLRNPTSPAVTSMTPESLFRTLLQNLRPFIDRFEMDRGILDEDGKSLTQWLRDFE